MGFVMISFWWDFLLLVVTLLGLCYVWLVNKYDYWKKKGVPGPKPTFLVGNIGKVLTRKLSMGEQFTELYNETKNLPYIGVFTIQRPTIVVNDVEMIKRMLTEDFANFTDRSFQINIKYEPLADNLLNARGSRWKNMRAKMTPTFTSSRMKEMFHSVLECSNEMLIYLNENGNDQIVDVKELLAKLNTDVIGTCAFGIDCNSFKDPNSKFRMMGKRFFNLPLWAAMLQLMGFFAPKIVWNLKISILGKEFTDFFVNTVKDVIEHRTKHGVVRKDFIQILMQMMKEDEEAVAADKADAPVDDGTRLTLLQLAAQVFVFFIAGFETSSTTSSFALYELALNPDVQKKLAEEVDDLMLKHDGKLTYDSLAKLTYMSKVIDETMRKYPPLPVLFRLCTKDYIIPNTDITIEKGTPVMIPVYGIHRDPDIYPNPDKFDPERFSPENKESRHHFAYLPFGEGPRICIGNRFAMMQVKLGLATLLSKYEVSVCDKTPIPMVYDKKSFVLSSEAGIYLRVKERLK